MLHVSSAYESAINSDSRDMTYRVTLGGSIVLDKNVVTNMTLNESMSGGNGLAVGSSNAAELTLALRNPDVLEYKGMQVEPESGIVLPDGSIEWVPLGRFWVTNVSTGNDYKTVKLTCADGMYLLSGEYVSNLTYPTSIRAVVREIVSQAGVDFVEPEVWPNVIVRVKPEKLTLRNAIGYAAGCCGRNARFNRQGKLELVWYEDAGITIEREAQYLDGMVKLHDKPLQVNFEVTGAKEKYECFVICGENGKVTAGPSKGILEGDTVTLSVRPDKAYVLASITAQDAFGNEVTLIEDAEGAGYTFVQPDSNVTVTASFKENTEGPFKLTVRSGGNGSIAYAVSETEHEEGLNYFAPGEEVVLFVTPNEGFTVRDFTSIPSGIVIEEAGTTSDGDLVYSFIMPQSDVSVTVYFREDTSHAIAWNFVHDCPYEPGFLSITNDTTGGNVYNTGDAISVHLAIIEGYEVDSIDCNVPITQVDECNFKFVMPGYDVSITVYLKQSIDESIAGSLSFLQSPSLAPPPVEKPYWAVLYVYDESGYGQHNYYGVNGKYYLVWFDSWSASGATSLEGKTAYTVRTKGYYYCGSKSDENGRHCWDTLYWSGNGSASSSYAWEMPLGRWHEGYCLVATNANLYLNDAKLLFSKNDVAIGDVQTDWVVDGVDVRETGALSFNPCPDTYSTPIPGANWVFVDNGYVYKTDEEATFGFSCLVGSYRNKILYFDSVIVENVGKHWSNQDNNVFKLTFPSATVVEMSLEGGFEKTTIIDEPCYILVEDPSLFMEGKNAAQGRSENTCGLRASNITLSCDGMLFHNNAPILCDCVSEMSTFFMRSVRAVNADPVTLTYTNPMIYEKMVPAIQNAMQGMTYTPAKIKHRGNPAFQAGDIVTVPDGKGEYHTVLIMQQTMTFGGGMNSDITCPGQTAETANFTSASPVSIQIKEEVSKTYSEMAHDDTSQTAAMVSALYATITSVRNTLQSSILDVSGDVANVSTEVARLNQRLTAVEDELPQLGERVDALEIELSYLDKDLSDVQTAVAALEGAMGNAQADIETINAAIATLDEAVEALLIDVEDLQTRVEALETGFADLGDRTTAIEGREVEMDARVTALEDKTELGDLKRQLAETDKQIAHCAEVFMLEVMVNGTTPSSVALPYDISELHNTRETLRANIAALEVEPNE